MLRNYWAKAVGMCLLALLSVSVPAAAASSPPPQGAAGKKKAPQAKSKEEYAAFMAANNAATPEAAEAAASEFEVKFPKSELLSILFQQVMAKYEQANNSAKTIAMGRKALQYDPDNADALVLTSVVVAESTRETDIDRDAKLKEVTDDATKVLRLIESGNFYLGAAATAEQQQAYRDMVTYMANAALGQASLLNKQDAAAEQQFRKALATKQGAQDPMTWLRLCYALEHQGKNADALNAANKAAALAPASSPIAEAAKQEQDRLKQQAH